MPEYRNVWVRSPVMSHHLQMGNTSTARPSFFGFLHPDMTSQLRAQVFIAIRGIGLRLTADFTQEMLGDWVVLVDCRLPIILGCILSTAWARTRVCADLAKAESHFELASSFTSPAFR